MDSLTLYGLVSVVLMLIFYAVLGYLSSAGMFGDHPRWRGMNRGPADFGLRSGSRAGWWW